MLSVNQTLHRSFFYRLIFTSFCYLGAFSKFTKVIIYVRPEIHDWDKKKLYCQEILFLLSVQYNVATC